MSAAKALLAVVVTALIATAALFSAATNASAVTSLDLEARALELRTACSSTQTAVDRLVKCQRSKHRAVVLRHMVRREDRDVLRLTKSVNKLNRAVLEADDVTASTFDVVLALNATVLRLDTTALQLSERALPSYPTRLTTKIDKAAKVVRGLDKKVRSEEPETWVVSPAIADITPEDPVDPDPWVVVPIVPEVSPEDPVDPAPEPTPNPTPTALETAPTYYVKNGGNDSLDGRSDATAWATVGRVNRATLSPGQSVGFKRGDTWREALVVPSSGSSGNPVTFRAYGTGDKPKLLGSLNYSSSAGWINQGGSIWRWSTSSGSTEICALHFNGATSHGVRKTSSTMTTQGNFYWSGGYTYLYSTVNPGLYYSGIEAARYLNGVHIQTRSHVTVKDLDLRYWGRHGIAAYPGNYRTIENNEISYIGFGTASLPMGNGIELEAGTYGVVRHNRVHQCADAGLSAMTHSSSVLGNTQFYGNVVSNCEYGFEMQAPGEMQYRDVRVEGNVFFDMGDTVWHSYRPANDMWGLAFQSWSGYTVAISCQFNGNIVYQSRYSHVRLPAVGWTSNGNRYYADGATMFRVYGGFAGTFARWQAAGHDTTGSLIGAVPGTDEEIIAALAVMAVTAR